MNIGEVVKKLQIKHPSVTISRIRFLEKEGLVNIKRTPGGTRKFSNKDIQRISKIIYLRNIKSIIKITGETSIEPKVGIKRLILFKAG